MAESIGFSGNSRRLLFQAKQQAMGGMTMPSSSQDACSNPHTGAPCSTAAASTLLVIIIGMSAMMLLVLIAIVLLCRSHVLYTESMEHSRQSARVAGHETGGAAGVGTSSTVSAVPDDSAVSCDDVVLVLFPGEKYPVTCARVSPLYTVEPTQASSGMNKDNPQETP